VRLVELSPAQAGFKLCLERLKLNLRLISHSSRLETKTERSRMRLESNFLLRFFEFWSSLLCCYFSSGSSGQEITTWSSGLMREEEEEVMLLL
jgi:hypothetical protein